MSRHSILLFSLSLAACDATPIATQPDSLTPPADTSAADVAPVPSTLCGDAKIQGDEACDDGELNGRYAHCNTDCTGPGAYCGDGLAQAGVEDCDDGDLNGQWNHCGVACNGPAERCGNGFIESAFEACDDGDDNGRYGFCKADCSGPDTGCGDGIVTAPFESCDEGSFNGRPGHCAADCAPTPGCGDGTTVAPEACDEGDLNGQYGHCAADCSGAGPTCGDGRIFGGVEACDDGTDNGTYGNCAPDCQGLAAHCGDGVLDPVREVCDDGEFNGTIDHCERDCTGLTASWLVNKRSANVCSDDDLLAKYLLYRKRLRGDGTAYFPGFVVRDNIPGGGIPASWRNKDQQCSQYWGFATCGRADAPDARGLYKWGDGTSWLGDWLGLLGLEHKMFRMLGRSTEETEADIILALKTIDRLDVGADAFFGVTREPDGFFLRDDVSADFARDGDTWRFPRDPETSGFDGYGCVAADLACEAPNVEAGSYTSQDQTISLVYGLAMVAELIDPNTSFEGVNLREAARAKTHLLINALRSAGWKVTAPDGSHPPDKWGGNAIWFSDALAQVADRVLGRDYGVSGYRNFASRTLGAASWDAFQAIWMATHFYNRNMSMMLAGAGQIWSMNKLAKKAAEDNKDYYALVGAVLSGRKLDGPYADWRVEGILRSAPCGGPCAGHADCDARVGWLSESRIFTAHDRAGTRHVGSGEFNGIDYMSLFAAWVIYRGGYRVPEAAIGACETPVHLRDMNVGDVLDARTPCGGADLETLYCGRAVGSWIDDAARGRVTIFVRGSRLQCAPGGACVLVGSGPEHTDGDDLILGSEGDDELFGGAGQDCLIGFGGNDRIEGNQGLDHIDGGEGDDDLYGEAKGLILDGEPDVIHGGPGNDYLDGGPGGDELYGEDGDDEMFGGNGEDIMLGGAGNDEMHGGNEEDVMRGGTGDDICIGDGSADAIFGDDGRDKLDGEAGDDYLEGGAGADFVKGGTGNDEMSSGEWGEPAIDRMCGNGGDDTIWAGPGDQCLGGGWLLGGKDEVHDCSDESASEHDCNAGSFNRW